MLILSIYVINLGYAFEGTFQRLDSYVFRSSLLAGDAETEAEFGSLPGNRFSDTWLGSILVPLPANYVLGIDAQKREFEDKMWSFLRGEWRLGGWWHYYLYALAIKVPLGTWLLAGLALGSGLRWRGYESTWRDELVLIVPVAVLLFLVSSQTGFNHHVRYVLPIFPFAYIWISRVAVVAARSRWVGCAVAVALAWSVASSLFIYPHSLSYFNELVGGPIHGHAHLHDSNIDWGQDLLYLKRWLDEHPEAQPIGLAYSLPAWLLDPKDVRDSVYLASPWAGDGSGSGPHFSSIGRAASRLVCDLRSPTS